MLAFLGIVDVLAPVEVMANGRGQRVGGVVVFRHFLEFEHGLEHLRDLFLVLFAKFFLT